MSNKRLRHSYYTDADSPTRLVLNYLKGSPGRSLQVEMDDLLLVHLYPYALKQAGAASELVETQIQASILRLRQAITALEAISSLTQLEKAKSPAVTASLEVQSPEPLTEEEDAYLPPEDSF